MSWERRRDAECRILLSMLEPEGRKTELFRPCRGSLFSISRFRGFASLTPGYVSCSPPGRKIRFSNTPGPLAPTKLQMAGYIEFCHTPKCACSGSLNLRRVGPYRKRMRALGETPVPGRLMSFLSSLLRRKLKNQSIRVGKTWKDWSKA